VKQRFEEFEKNYLSTVPNSNNIRNHIKRVIGNMMSGPGKENNDFRNSISGIDAIRDENFISIYPELREMMDSTK
jgi:hypothetical protein